MKPEAFLFAVLMIGGFALILWSLNLRHRRRELQHRERMAAIEKGAPLPPLPMEANPWSPRAYLLKGMIWLFTGIALTAFVGGVAVASRRPSSLETKIWRVQNLRQQGASEDQINQFLREERMEGVSPAAALIGLIPIAVGAAYLIYFRVESGSGPVRDV